jgi:acyl-CoA thioesterase-1
MLEAMLRPALLLLLLLAACDRTAQAPAPAPTPPLEAAPVAEGRRLVFLGDSLTAGLGVAKEAAFPALLEARLKSEGRAWTVVNAGVSGDTTAGGVARLDWIYRSRVEVLVVALGANDGLRGLPVAESERNLAFILRRAAQEGSAVLLVGMQLPENLGPDYRARFAAVFPRLAREHRVALLPFLLEGVAMNPGLNQPDGIHPNAEGHRRVAGTVWAALEPVLRRAEQK